MSANNSEKIRNTLIEFGKIYKLTKEQLLVAKALPFKLYDKERNKAGYRKYLGVLKGMDSLDSKNIVQQISQLFCSINRINLR